jgi:transcriptional regulator GlxA family with amidase domain
VLGPVASDPTVSRLIDGLAAAGPKASVVALAHRFDVSEGTITRLFKICRSGSSP